MHFYDDNLTDSARIYYYLILNGFRIDKFVLSGTSENMVVYVLRNRDFTHVLTIENVSSHDASGKYD